LTLINTLQELSDWRNSLSVSSSSIGFVPTMGALHHGHIALVQRSLKENDITLVSIFVNPTQFNDPHDFLHYPKRSQEDVALLKKCGDVVIFMPSTEEMYPEMAKEHFSHGPMTSTLEALKRPGHFDGVITIIRKLFDGVQAHRVYLGEKDFQQLAVIKAWVQQEKRQEIIVPCATVREEDGLAMSSRNLRLTTLQREQAPFIFQTLKGVQNQISLQSPPELEIWARAMFQNHPEFELDYFEIIDGNSFAPLADWEDSTFPVAVVAAYMGKIRLIDNLPLTVPRV
jgi:pantoate--beta-alanine ligase